MNLIGQSIGTGLWAALIVGSILLVKHMLMIERNWPYVALGIVLAALVVFPHGWSAMFGSPDLDVYEFMAHKQRHMPSSSALFGADFWGALVGGAIAFLGVQYLKHRFD